jgi:hypothetical protein
MLRPVDRAAPVSPIPGRRCEPVYNAPMPAAPKPEPDLPPLPGEITMEELMALARRLSEHPENRPGTDKTWLLEAMRRFQQFVSSPRTCIAVGGKPLPKTDAPEPE